MAIGYRIERFSVRITSLERLHYNSFSYTGLFDFHMFLAVYWHVYIYPICAWVLARCLFVKQKLKQWAIHMYWMRTTTAFVSKNNCFYCFGHFVSHLHGSKYTTTIKKSLKSHKNTYLNWDISKVHNRSSKFSPPFCEKSKQNFYYVKNEREWEWKQIKITALCQRLTVSMWARLLLTNNKL